MFVIESARQDWRWISAVVPTLTEAESEIARIPDAQRQFHRLIEIPCTAFPVFIVEDRDFAFGDMALVRARISALLPSGDEDAILLNVYVLESAFIPEIPGRDEMGGIYHWHITDSDLTPSGMADLMADFNAHLENRAAAA
ncbi:MAG: hypothetical protein LBF93_00735 [Zoogloeaceae bacterium]|jgi:hypothetical protein|nr:hypothetical protein [Zoogloeaceae bacterium]